MTTQLKVFQVADELRREAQINSLCGSEEWTTLLNSAADALERLGNALLRIRDYPVHSEPIGGAMAMQEIANGAFDSMQTANLTRFEIESHIKTIADDCAFTMPLWLAGMLAAECKRQKLRKVRYDGTDFCVSVRIK